jgi:hypothetical protein
MAKLNEVQVDIYRCDGCGAIMSSDPIMKERPYGYHGTVDIIDCTGGYGGKWYACKPACIKKAVLSTSDPNRDEDLA